MNGPSGERVTEWAGGSLSELMSVLSGAALPARIRVFAPGAGGALAGEVHLLAGGLNDAFAGNKRGQEAASALQRVAGARFVIDTRLPDPETGSLAKPGPAEGSLAQRPLVEIMRYCEDYVLTCTLEVWRGEEQARISYRRGELVGTTIGGSDAPERLPEVMAWKEGFFEIDLPLPVTPPVPAPSRRNTGSAAVVGDGAPARPLSGERPRRETDPLISLAAIKKSAPPRPAGVPVRPTGEGAPKLPRVPSLPGFKSRVTAPAQALAPPAAGLKPAPAGPVPGPAAAPLRAGAPPLASLAGAAAGARAAQAPVVAHATPTMPAAHPSSTAGVSAQTGVGKQPQVHPAPAPKAREVVPAPPAVATGLPVARAPDTARLPQAPVPSARAPIARPAVPAAASSLAPVPWPAAKPAAVRPLAQPASAPAAEPAAAAASHSASAAANPPPPASLALPPADVPAAPVRLKTPPPAPPPPVQAVSAAASQPTGAVSSPAALAPPASPSPPSTRGASTPAAEVAPSPLNHISGEFRRPSASLPEVDERPFGVELSEDMQDPAAFVETPEPVPQVAAAWAAQATPTPISPAPERGEPPNLRLTPIAAGQPDDLAVDIEDPRFRPGERRAGRGIGSWSLVVHVLLGVALGAAIVAAYSYYYGLPLP